MKHAVSTLSVLNVSIALGCYPVSNKDYYYVQSFNTQLLGCDH